jgi:ABC-type amino acid transport system permease subunit
MVLLIVCLIRTIPDVTQLRGFIRTGTREVSLGIGKLMQGLIAACFNESGRAVVLIRIARGGFMAVPDGRRKFMRNIRQ